MDAFRLRLRTCKNLVGFGVSSFITQFAITIVMALTNNLLASYGAASVYGSEIPLTATGIVMKVNQILISILVGISVGAQPIIGFNYGAKNFMRVKKALDMALLVSEIIAVAAFLIFQFAPMSVVRLFGAEEGLYNEFAVLAFRIFLLLCPPDRLPDRGGRVFAGRGQAGQIGSFVAGAADHLLCARGAAAAPVLGGCGRAVDRPGGRRAGLPVVPGACLLYTSRCV